jgi:hypothetical protein
VPDDLATTPEQSESITPPAPIVPKIGSITTSKIAGLTGPTAPVSQQAVDICGTDLGIMCEHDGRVYFAFGDTFGYDGDTCTGNGGPNWRSNSLAWVDNPQPDKGIGLADWLTGSDGKAIAVLDGAHVEPGDDPTSELTKIPTATAAIGDTLYLHYMSVHDFAAQGGVWSCNYSNWLSSTDSGHTWTEAPTKFAGSDSNFIELAVTAATTPDNPDGAYLYALGTPSGRFGGAQLGRVPVSSITDPTTWEYAGSVAAGATTPSWSADPADAVTVVPAPVGEASLLWNPVLQRWMYTYLNENAAALQLREADHLWGPWTDPHTITTATDYPQLYGAFMTPSLLTADGMTFYFVMSQYGPYNTFLMKAQLTTASQGNAVSRLLQRWVGRKG